MSSQFKFRAILSLLTEKNMLKEGDIPISRRAVGV
jgi:hypothetical protein